MRTKEKVADIRAKHPKLPAAQIAQHLGVTRQYVDTLLRELGLPTSFRTRAPPDPGGWSKENQKRLTELCRRFNGLCQYCGVKCERGSPDVGLQPSLDRIVPYVKGGKYGPENEILACRRCNSLKGTRDMDAARHLIALRCLGWPVMSREAMAWIKAQGIDISAYETFKYQFER